jgi:hypothetical protein
LSEALLFQKWPQALLLSEVQLAWRPLAALAWLALLLAAG